MSPATFKRRDIALLLSAAVLGGAAPLPRDPNPDATIEIEQVRAGILVLGGTVGGGRLHYQGETYAFSVDGFELGMVGVATLRARGEVFGLRRKDDFPGAYTETTAPATLGGSGASGTLWLRNRAGVVLRLRADENGGVLRIRGSGLTIAFR